MWVAKLKDNSSRASTTFVRVDAFGITLVESMGDASTWGDEAIAWHYAERAAHEFSMAFIAAPKQSARLAPRKAEANSTKTANQFRQSKRAKRKNYLAQRFM